MDFIGHGCSSVWVCMRFCLYLSISLCIIIPTEILYNHLMYSTSALNASIEATLVFISALYKRGY